jgi:hypothetical protein
MKTIICTSDACLIKSALAGYYESVIFDGCPDYESFVPDVENSVWFILKQDSYTSDSAVCESQIAGIIKLENLNLTTWIPHILIYPEFRQNGSETWGLAVAQYMKERLKDVCFLVMTPYESAKNYALRMGFNYIGVLPKSIKKDGKLMDQYMLSGGTL